MDLECAGRLGAAPSGEPGPECADQGFDAGVDVGAVEGGEAGVEGRLERDGTAMLVVEQNLDFALRIADRWAVLKLGAIDDEGVCEPDARARVLEHLSL